VSSIPKITVQLVLHQSLATLLRTARNTRLCVHRRLADDDWFTNQHACK